MTSIPPDDVLRFDRFALDRRQRVLLRDGKIVRLTPKAFDLLEMLVSRPDQVVSKSELVDRVWPDTYVSDTSLSKLVFMVRKKLGDGPDGRPYVETIPKRGYRFVANAGDEERPPVAEQPPRRRPRVMITAVIAALVIAAVSAGVWWRARGRGAKPDRTYLVVMPFAAATGGDEALAHGISEFVTARLSTIQGVSVMPPMLAASNNADPRAVARQLGANLILEGTVQRTGNRIGVACRVMPVEKKSQMRAAFSLASSDIFEIEERVSGSVATLLDLNQSLGRTADPALATPDRQQAYVRAIGLLSRFGHESRIDEAVSLLEPLAAPGTRPSALVTTALGRAHLLRFKLYGDRKDLEVAQAFAARATSLGGGKARVRALRGAIARARGDLGVAATELQAALQLEPDANDVLLDLASVYSAMGQTKKAEATYDYVTRIHPLCAVCFNSYGLFYNKAGRLDDAVAMHQRAIAIDPESSKFQSDLAVAFMLLGRFREAIPFLEKAVAISRDNEVLSNLGYSQYLVGDFEAAAKHFGEATERAPSDYLVWGNLGDALRCLPARAHEGDQAFARAIALARDALQVNAGDAVVRAHLAEYLAKHGDAAAAEKEIAAALAAGPGQQDEADILFSAAAVAAVHGRKSAAVDYLERAAAAGTAPALFTVDPQFSSLRSEAKFRAMGSPRPAALTANAAR